MSRRTCTIQANYFDALYAEDPDPWRFRSSAYEREKYSDTLALMDRAPYAAALEIGCSIGVFTRMLAPHCRRLIAIDPSPAALGAAREACAGVETVTFEQRMVPEDLPNGPFNLIVLSEVLYYLAASDAQTTARLCCEQLAPGGQTILCHWLGATDYPLTGEEAAQIFVEIASARSLQVETIWRAEYRLDRVTNSAPWKL